MAAVNYSKEMGRSVSERLFRLHVANEAIVERLRKSTSQYSLGLAN